MQKWPDTQRRWLHPRVLQKIRFVAPWQLMPRLVRGMGRLRNIGSPIGGQHVLGRTSVNVLGRTSGSGMPGSRKHGMCAEAHGRGSEEKDDGLRVYGMWEADMRSSHLAELNELQVVMRLSALHR